MCSYSMIADHYTDRWKETYPQFVVYPPQQDMPSRVEFEALRKEVESLKELLIKAKEYDAKSGQPDCEMAEKVALLKRVAELVGVDLGAAMPNTSS